ncbi:hypothetical protein D3C81_1606090 [compost metagenome]
MPIIEWYLGSSPLISRLRNLISPLVKYLILLILYLFSCDCERYNIFKASVCCKLKSSIRDDIAPLLRNSRSQTSYIFNCIENSCCTSFTTQSLWPKLSEYAQETQQGINICSLVKGWILPQFLQTDSMGMLCILHISMSLICQINL